MTSSGNGNGSVDECVAAAEEWLKRASTAHGQGYVKTEDRAAMVSACSDVADTWVRLAELARLREADAELDAAFAANEHESDPAVTGCGCIGPGGTGKPEVAA